MGAPAQPDEAAPKEEQRVAGGEEDDDAQVLAGHAERVAGEGLDLAEDAGDGQQADRQGQEAPAALPVEEVVAQREDAEEDEGQADRVGE